MKRAAKKTNHSGKNRHEFPRISRFIPERKMILASVATPVGKFYAILYLFVLLAGVLAGLQLVKDYQANRQLSLERTKLSAELTFWKQIEKQYPDFRDAYYNAAIVEYKLRDFSAASADVASTLEIDPNFQKGIELEKLLQR